MSDNSSRQRGSQRNPCSSNLSCQTTIIFLPACTRVSFLSRRVIEFNWQMLQIPACQLTVSSGHPARRPEAESEILYMRSKLTEMSPKRLNLMHDSAYNKAVLRVLSMCCCNGIVLQRDFVTHCLPNKSRWAIMTESTLCVVLSHMQKRTHPGPDACWVWIPPEEQKLLDPSDGTDPKQLKMENCCLLSPTQASHSTFCLQHSTPLSLCLACRK